VLVFFRKVFEFCEETCPTDLSKLYSDQEFENAANRALSDATDDMHWREKSKHWLKSGGKSKGRIPDLPVSITENEMRYL